MKFTGLHARDEETYESQPTPFSFFPAPLVAGGRRRGDKLRVKAIGVDGKFEVRPCNDPGVPREDGYNRPDLIGNGNFSEARSDSARFNQGRRNLARNSTMIVTCPECEQKMRVNAEVSAGQTHQVPQMRHSLPGDWRR